MQSTEEERTMINRDVNEHDREKEEKASSVWMRNEHEGAKEETTSSVWTKQTKILVYSCGWWVREK